jgi:aryl-alcohol dehydrogenase-like predicted oxidoreductase
VTFSVVDYTTGFEAVEELRKLVQLGVSMSQFVLRWILMFDAVTCAIPDSKRADGLRTTPTLAGSPPLTDDQMAAVSCKSDWTLSSIALGA